MINQSAIGLNSRSEANPFNEDGFLPLITAPMYSVVDENNYQAFLDNKIQVCLPRKVELSGESIIKYGSNAPIWFSLSLQEFIDYWCNPESPATKFPSKYKICIDTANGNMPALHDAIRKAKEIHGDNLIIMAGNVGSVEAFVELAKTGVDYIRVGIGGGGGCNTTSNTGVGQENLKDLIEECKKRIFGNVKIVADGISSWVKFCEKEYRYNDNGYAAINELLFAGADLVMVGKLFAQCVESAGEKRIKSGNTYIEYLKTDTFWRSRPYREGDILEVMYSGMSTQQEQKKYKDINYPIYILEDTELNAKGRICINRELIIGETIVYNNSDIKIIYKVPYSEENKFYYETNCEMLFKIGDRFHLKSHQKFKPSEGSVQWIPVRYTLPEWLEGVEKNQDEEPYLMGWINSIKSAMAYTGKTKL